MEYKRIEEFATVVTGGTPSTAKSEYWDDGNIPWLQSGCCQNCDVDTVEKYITQEGYDNSSTRMMPPNTVMIALTGATAGKVGYLKFEACGNQSITGIFPCDSMNQRYLFYYLLSQRKKILADCVGGAQTHISQSYVKKIQVPMLPLIEQEKIVEVLTKLSNVISKRQDEIIVIDDLIKARFVEMFGDPIKNPKEYSVHQLSEYITSLTSGSRGWAQYCVDDGCEWFITIKNVKDCHIITDNMQPINAPDNAEAKRTKVQEGDLLISITADLGRTGVVTKEIAEHGAYINQHLSCIRVNKEKLNPLFAAYYMESPAGKEQFIAKNQSAVKAGLNFNAINSLKLIVPPMKEQDNFINFVHQVDKSKFVLQKKFQIIHYSDII